MKMRSLLVAVWFLLPSMMYLSADDVRPVVVENPVPADSFGEVTVKLEEGDKVAFQVFPIPKKQRQIGGSLFLNGPKGTKYTVLVTVVNFGDKPGTVKRFDTGAVEVTIAGEGGGGDEVIPPPDTEGATLTSALKAAYKKENEGEKALAPKLRDLYAKYANLTLLGSYKTWGEVEGAMRKDAKEFEVFGKLVGLQEVIAEYLTRRLPGRSDGWELSPVTEASRKAAKDAFQTVTNALEKLK